MWLKSSPHPPTRSRCRPRLPATARARRPRPIPPFPLPPRSGRSDAADRRLSRTARANARLQKRAAVLETEASRQRPALTRDRRALAELAPERRWLRYAPKVEVAASG